MINLQRNTVIFFKEFEVKKRLLYIDVAMDFTVFFEIKDKPTFSGLESIRYSHLQELLINDHAFEVPDSFRSLFFAEDHQIAEIRRKKRDLYWPILEPLLLNHFVELLYSNSRRAILSEQADIHGIDIRTLEKKLMQVWTRGLGANSLLGDNNKSGGRGQSRIENRSAKSPKAGRPMSDVVQTHFGVTGRNVLPSDLKIFAYVLEKMKKKEEHYESIPIAYKTMLANFYGVDLNDKSISNQEYRNQVPSEGQFRYFVRKNLTNMDRLESQFDKNASWMRSRPMNHRSETRIYAPGSAYQIDATVADIYLVHHIYRDRVIGRPTLYFVTDVFTRMIVGFHLTMEKPSWEGARLALEHAFSDKTEFCKTLELPLDDWPSLGVPDELIVDRGEIRSKNGQSLKLLGIGIEFNAAYRPDLKGIVEGLFNLFNFWLIHIYQREYQPISNAEAKSGINYQYDAKFDLFQLRKLIANRCQVFNQTHNLGDYCQKLGMLQDQIDPTPMGLLEWGLVNRPRNFTKKVDPLVAHIAMLPRADASFTMRGLYFDGLYYAYDDDVDIDFKRIYQVVRIAKKTIPIRIAYHKGSLNSVYYMKPNRDGGVTPLRFSLSLMSEVFRDISYYEYQYHKHNKTGISLINERPHLEKYREALEYEDKINQEATDLSLPIDLKNQDIGANRILVREEERGADADRYINVPEETSVTASDVETLGDSENQPMPNLRPQEYEILSLPQSGATDADSESEIEIEDDFWNSYQDR